MWSVQAPEPKLLSSSTERRPQRSMSAPASGDSSVFGRVANRVINDRAVADPVCRYAHTPSAKPDRPEPRFEMTCPIQSTTKSRMPRGRPGIGSTTGLGSLIQRLAFDHAFLGGEEGVQLRFGQPLHLVEQAGDPSGVDVCHR